MARRHGEVHLDEVGRGLCRCGRQDRCSQRIRPRLGAAAIRDVLGELGNVGGGVADANQHLGGRLKSAAKLVVRSVSASQTRDRRRVRIRIGDGKRLGTEAERLGLRRGRSLVGRARQLDQERGGIGRETRGERSGEPGHAGGNDSDGRPTPSASPMSSVLW